MAVLWSERGLVVWTTGGLLITKVETGCVSHKRQCLGAPDRNRYYRRRLTQAHVSLT